MLMRSMARCVSPILIRERFLQEQVEHTEERAVIHDRSDPRPDSRRPVVGVDHLRLRRVCRRAHSLPFWGVHVAAGLGVLATGWSWSGLALALALYYGRMFFLTAAFHRYFAHRSFKTSRPFQLVLAIGGTLCAQKGPLWWAAHHRRHHRFSDGPRDVHSPRQRGFWWSHVGWILGPDHEQTDLDAIRDFASYPELRWLNRHYLVAPIALAGGLFLAGGSWALLWGFFVSTTLLWHGTFLVNSLAHVVGSRRYDTDDDSRNNAVIALLTMGEGWHNNHHHYPSSARQGFFWWEIDPTYYVLRVFERIGLVHQLRRPPSHVVAGSTTRTRPPIERA
jgi:stearoyl-CoA desaturase (Delta-9 desaturase)